MVEGTEDPMDAKLPPFEYIRDLNETAQYALRHGAPFLVYSHYVFMRTYISAWQERYPADGAASLNGITSRFFTRLVEAGWIPRFVKRWIPAASWLCLMVIGLYEPALDTISGIARRGIRSIPPLITALVVVFVTSDAWRILGTGFTVRFYIIVGLFLLASLFFLIRRDYWKDLAVSAADAELLLNSKGIKRRASISGFVQRGAAPLPLIRPLGLGGRGFVYCTYLAYAAISLIVTAALVAASLVLVGIILINAQETELLAHSLNTYATLPGHLVITRQLLSLSLTLGAFAAFFLVAGQRPEDRDEFMRHMLRQPRRVLLVYSVYCRAHDHAYQWTDIAPGAADTN